MIDEDLIIELWDLFKEYVPEKSRGAAAEQFIEYLLDKGIENSVIEGLAGYDPDLDEAIEVTDEEDDEEDDDYSDDWDDGEGY